MLTAADFFFFYGFHNILPTTAASAVDGHLLSLVFGRLLREKRHFQKSGFGELCVMHRIYTHPCVTNVVHTTGVRYIVHIL